MKSVLNKHIEEYHRNKAREMDKDELIRVINYEKEVNDYVNDEIEKAFAAWDYRTED